MLEILVFCGDLLSTLLGIPDRDFHLLLSDLGFILEYFPENVVEY